MRGNVRYGFGAQDAKFGTDLQGALSGYSDQQVQFGQQRDAALYEAQLGAARETQQNALWSPTDYSGMEQAVYGEDPVVDTVTPPRVNTGVKAAAPLNIPGASAAEAMRINNARPKQILPTVKYYTYKKDVKLKSGQTLGFTTGKGYYAKGGS